MRQYARLIMFCLLLLSFLRPAPVCAQVVDVLRTVQLHEKKLATLGFFQDDFTGDGHMDFLTDGDGKKHIAICTLINNDIVVLHQLTIPIDDDFKALLYEDVNGDGVKEIYMFIEETGLIQLSRADLSPVDTFSIFEQFAHFVDMTLVDTELDLQPEWVILDNIDGLAVVDPVSQSIVSIYPAIDGSSFKAGNVDGDPAPELVLQYISDLLIIDPLTGLTTHTVDYNSLDDYQLIDIDQDGRQYIVSRENRSIRIHDAISKTFVGTYNAPFTTTFDDFFPFELDGDEKLELVLYSDDFSHVIWMNTFPMTIITRYDIKGMRDLGQFIAQSTLSPDPNDLLFVLDDPFSAKSGLVRFNLLSKEATLTNIRDQPNALHYMPFGTEAKFHFVSVPNSAYNTYLTTLDPADFSAALTLDADALFFVENGIDIHQRLGRIQFRGITDPHLLIQTGSEYVFYNTITGYYRRFIQSGTYKKYTADIDFDGNSEFLVQSDEGLVVNSLEPGYALSPRFTIPGISGHNIVTGQADTSATQEIIAFVNRTFRIYSGDDGNLIRERTDMVNQTISEIRPFTNGQDDFYLAIVCPNNFFVYDIAGDSIQTQIPLGPGLQPATGQVIQFVLGGQVRNYYVTQKDALKVYNSLGTAIFQDADIETHFDLDGEIIVDDFDNDGFPNMLASTPDAYVELQLRALGQYATTPFYVTTVFPKNGAVTDSDASFLVQFSEPVDALTAKDHIQLVSSNTGDLNVTIEQESAMQLRLRGDFQSPDFITLSIDGNLLSTLGHKLDANYDGLSAANAEPPYTSVIQLSTDAEIPTVSVTALSTLPEIVYSATKRFLPFEVSVMSTNNTRNLERFSFQINDGPFALAVPADSVYDEAVELVMIPLNTFGLAEGEYTLRYTADLPSEVAGDTFSHTFTVVHELRNHDKNPGSNLQRTSTLDNQVIGSKFELIKTIPHGLNPISHVVGGQGTFTYTEYSRPGFGQQGTVRNFDLHDQQPNWEREYTMIGNYNPPHLDHGIVYITSHATGSSNPQTLHALDVNTGETILQQPYQTTWGNDASTITTAHHILLPDNMGHGIYCLDRWTGEHLWFGQSKPTYIGTGSPSVYNGIVYEIHSENIQAFDLATGTELWSTIVDEEETSFGKMAVIDTVHGTIFWPGSSKLYAFDIHTGDLKWSKVTGEARRNVVVHNDEVIHFSNTAIQFFKTADGAFSRSKTISIAPAGQPVAANGKLFLPLFDGFHVYELDDLTETFSLPITVTDVSVIDSFLFLREVNDLHIYRATDVVSVDHVNQSSISVYPNPFTTDFTIHTEDGTIDHVEMYDAIGKVHYSGSVESLKCDELQPGMYVLVVRMRDGRRWSAPVIKM